MNLYPEQVSAPMRTKCCLWFLIEVVQGPVSGYVDLCCWPIEYSPVAVNRSALVSKSMLLNPCITSLLPQPFSS